MPATVPVDLSKPFDPRELEENPYSIDRLAKLPILQLGLILQIRKIVLYIGGSLLRQLPIRKGRDVLLRTSHHSTVERRLNPWFMGFFHVPVPKRPHLILIG